MARIERTRVGLTPRTAYAGPLFFVLFCFALPRLALLVSKQNQLHHLSGKSEKESRQGIETTSTMTKWQISDGLRRRAEIDDNQVLASKGFCWCVAYVSSFKLFRLRAVQARDKHKRVVEETQEMDVDVDVGVREQTLVLLSEGSFSFHSAYRA